MRKIDRTYLMISGTLLPAFGAVYAVSSFMKLNKQATIGVFAVASIIGGFYTAKILKDLE